ncbi:MAG: hypothetical protein HUK20_01055, partial [Fibrobacter sp.]|nr:hypothetical protein [Fibrobacter sp.]
APKQPDIYTVDASGSIVMPPPSLTKIGVGSASQVVGKDETIVEFGYTLDNCTGASVTGLPAGVTAKVTDGSVTISGTPTEVGTFDVTITTEGGKGTAATKTAKFVVVAETLPTGKSVVDAYKTKVAGDGLEETEHGGTLNEGYFNFTNAVGSSATWEIFSPKSQITEIEIYYAVGKTDPCDVTISVNGDKGQVPFTGTGDWKTWKSIKVTVNLVAGKNEIKLISNTSAGGPNIDGFVFNRDGVVIWDASLGVEKGMALPMVSLNAHFNPYTGVLNVRTAGQVELSVFDLSGTRVGTVIANVMAGVNNIDFCSDMLARGAYMITVKQKGRLIAKARYVRW